MTFTDEVLARLADRELTLPGTPPQPAGLYVPFRLHAGFGFLAAQTSGYERFLGAVGAELTPESGREAAATAALNALARINQALDGFHRLVGLLHMAGYVASAPGFYDQPEVLDGASELFNFALGTRGQHTRTAFAPAQLPKRVAVELEITFAYQL